MLVLLDGTWKTLHTISTDHNEENCLCDGYGILIPTGQSYVVGGTVAVGEIYVVGGAGEIVPIGDLVSTNWVTILGTGISTTEIELNVKKSNIQKA